MARARSPLLGRRGALGRWWRGRGVGFVEVESRPDAGIYV